MASRRRDGVHKGPCHVHKAHAHTIGPDGSLYACPGFTGELATVDRPHRRSPRLVARDQLASRFDTAGPLERLRRLRVHPDVCAGGCLAASHSQLGDMNMPTCHKPSFESALISLAHDAASAA